ncbi:hypothetical protein [Gaopeijia maritima]|uniref:hypothetical protein n=1 Tax=Gaopeijia maritima TaxID=3119007 RepID=UPI00327BB92D
MNRLAEALRAPLRWVAPVGAVAAVLIAVGAVGAVGAQAQTVGATPSPVEPPVEYQLDDVEIEIDSRGCGYQLCARYRLTLRGDGGMSVVDRDYTVETTDANGSIERAEFVEVLETVYRADFFRLADAYRTTGGRLEVADDGRVRYAGSVWRTHQFDRTITVRIGDYSKSVVGYDGIPFAFLEVERRILAVPGVEEWLEMAPRGNRGG